MLVSTSSALRARFPSSVFVFLLPTFLSDFPFFFNFSTCLISLWQFACCQLASFYFLVARVAALAPADQAITTGGLAGAAWPRLTATWGILRFVHPPKRLKKVFFFVIAQKGPKVDNQAFSVEGEH